MLQRATSAGVDTISAAVMPDQGTFANPEGVGRIELADGRTLSVTLPDAYGRWRFATFCDTLRDSAPWSGGESVCDSRWCQLVEMSSPAGTG